MLHARHCCKTWRGWARPTCLASGLVRAQLRAYSDSKEEWRTIPNALTALRLCAVPGIVTAWYFPAPVFAAGLFGAAAVTDWLDGYLARRWKQQSALGALLDPLADKLLVSTTLILLVEQAASPQVTVPAALILGRELGVSSLREWAQRYRPEAVGNVSVAWHGSSDRDAQSSADTPEDLGSQLHTGSLALLWLAAGLTVMSGLQYAWALRL
ncbi:CDP-diacylglycerol--glycerol-3-phosphate 3-phosphatidyltransferase (Phosphatidylglycerophosphate synthase) (PGP synthase) [Durusdinium trenchii]|uniref:CDP-diacylglycerol--glycerol-3-phosphate 3-phosphatidyltransferase (Phosphatidylglycerophosphate synthase) (PGP synthase) n=1 Tax=Durusdinium trenchii TaxID=1381693 RepID=A0ABP0S3B5_9DINO